MLRSVLAIATVVLIGALAPLILRVLGLVFNSFGTMATWPRTT